MGCAAGGPRGEYTCTAEMIFRDLLFFCWTETGFSGMLYKICEGGFESLRA